MAGEDYDYRQMLGHTAPSGSRVLLGTDTRAETVANAPLSVSPSLTGTGDNTSRGRRLFHTTDEAVDIMMAGQVLTWSMIDRPPKRVR